MITNRLDPARMHQKGSTSRYLMIATTVLSLALIMATITFYRFKSDDPFNYADESASQLTENRNQWSSIEWTDPIEIVLDQTKAVFYWQTNSELSWKCNSKNGFDQGPSGEILIRHNDCFLTLPPHMASIKATQSELVLVRPQVDANIEITRTSLRIAENRLSYQYDIESKQSDIDTFESDDNARITLTIFAVESSVSEY